MKRVLRLIAVQWRPPVALGHPHLTTRDIAFDNMVIPKGAYLHLNAWAIQHDPARHENPDDFVPERYADDPTTVSVDLQEEAAELNILNLLSNSTGSTKYKRQRRNEA